MMLRRGFTCLVATPDSEKQKIATSAVDAHADSKVKETTYPNPYVQTLHTRSCDVVSELLSGNPDALKRTNSCKNIIKPPLPGKDEVPIFGIVCWILARTGDSP
jgi:hypothetical protein